MNPKRYQHVCFCSANQLKRGTKLYHPTSDHYLGKVVWIREHNGLCTSVCVDIPGRANTSIYPAHELLIQLD